MKEKFEMVKAWIMNNKMIAGVAAFILLFVLYKKFAGKRRPTRRRRSVLRVASNPRRRRSVNTVIKSGKNRGKKAWQIKGSEAARRHMAAIRRKRTRKLF
jgi:hypothetical protein